MIDLDRYVTKVAERLSREPGVEQVCVAERRGGVPPRLFVLGCGSVWVLDLVDPDRDEFNLEQFFTMEFIAGRLAEGQGSGGAVCLN